MRRSSLAALACGLLGCGGDATGSRTPTDIGDSRSAEDGGERPPSAREARSAVRQDGEEACALACGHVSQCAGESVAKGCEGDCRRELAQASGAPALRYAGCVQSLRCASLKRTTSRDVGPLGDCYIQAVRMGR